MKIKFIMLTSFPQRLQNDSYVLYCSTISCKFGLTVLFKPFEILFGNNSPKKMAFSHDLPTALFCSLDTTISLCICAFSSGPKAFSPAPSTSSNFTYSTMMLHDMIRLLKTWIILQGWAKTSFDTFYSLAIQLYKFVWIKNQFLQSHAKSIANKSLPRALIALYSKPYQNNQDIWIAKPQ